MADDLPSLITDFVRRTGQKLATGGIVRASAATLNLGEDRICVFPIRSKEQPMVQLSPILRYPQYSATIDINRGEGQGPEEQTIRTHEPAVFGAFLRAVADAEDPYIPDPQFPAPVPVWNTVHCDRCNKPSPTLLEKIRDVHRVQGNSGNWNFSPYMRGMFNGLELALSILEGERDPHYREEPDGYLCDLPDTGGDLSASAEGFKAEWLPECTHFLPTIGVVVNNQIMCGTCGRNTGMQTPADCGRCHPDHYAAALREIGPDRARAAWLNHFRNEHPDLAVKFATMQPEGLNPPLT